MLADYQFESVLDIGFGQGEHKRLLEIFGKKVFSVDVVHGVIKINIQRLNDH